MSTTTTKPGHSAMVQIYHLDYVVEIKEGSVILIDNWHLSERLTVSDWDQAEFRVYSSQTDTWSAINIRITGRKAQRRQGRLWVRCAIEFVQDGEPAIPHACWLLVGQ